MVKIALLGAGSTVFARNLIGDSFLTEALAESHVALYDIDPARLDESHRMVEALNRGVNRSRAVVTVHRGEAERREALRDADFVIMTIQVGGYRPSTVIDFEIPKKYGLRQTIADTLGIGGIFRGLRTIPVFLDIAREMEELCPGALMLNYTNPMAIVTGAVLAGTGIRAVGLCHSVQSCVPGLLASLDMVEPPEEVRWKIGGINHMAWLTEISHRGRDLYPEIRRRAAEKNAAARQPGGEKHGDMVRFEIMRHFGYYTTESSEHNAEYTPYWIRAAAPGLLEEFGIPLDEYPRRCERQIREWSEQRDRLVSVDRLSHERSHEYGSRIMEAVVTGSPARIHGNILNRGHIPNLPEGACVEVPCLVDGNGVQGVHFGALPEQCAALNRTSINVQLLTIQAALERNREAIYHAAYLDPHTAAELPLDRIRALCDELIEAHGDFLRL